MRRAERSSGVVSSPKVRTLVADIVVGVEGQVELLEPVDLRERRAFTAISCCSQTTGLKGEKKESEGKDKVTPDNLVQTFYRPHAGLRISYE